MPLHRRPDAVLGAMIAVALAAYARARAAQMQQPERQAPAAPDRPSVWQLLADVWQRMSRNNVSMMAAAVAFYALLATFPALSAAISLYGLVADRADIERHLQNLVGVLPAEALQLLSDQVHALVSAPPSKLGIGLIVSLALAVWSAASGTTILMQTLTIAYEEEEDRGLLTFYGVAIALTLGLIVFVILALALVAGVPAVLGALPLPQEWRDAVSLVRWPILALLVFAGLGLLYRFAPCRHEPRWDWLRPGTSIAVMLWLLGSAGFSVYVASFGSYDRTYGSLGAVVVLLMWFYLTGYIILAGAELNSEVEKARRRRPAVSADEESSRMPAPV